MMPHDIHTRSGSSLLLLSTQYNIYISDCQLIVPIILFLKLSTTEWNYYKWHVGKP